MPYIFPLLKMEAVSIFHVSLSFINSTPNKNNVEEYQRFQSFHTELSELSQSITATKYVHRLEETLQQIATNRMLVFAITQKNISSCIETSTATVRKGMDITTGQESNHRIAAIHERIYRRISQ